MDISPGAYGEDVATKEAPVSFVRLLRYSSRSPFLTPPSISFIVATTSSGGGLSAPT